MATTQEKWAERVGAWRSSGKTAEDFAAELDFKASTLRCWASKLKIGGASAALPPADPALKPAPTRPTAMIARVVRTRDEAPPHDELPPAMVEVVVGHARIVLRRGFDAEVLRQVVAALSPGASR